MTNIPSDQPPGPRVSETRARAGFKDKPVLWVLGIGTLLAAIALLGLFLANNSRMETMDADAGRDRRDAELFDQTPQAPKGD